MLMNTKLKYLIFLLVLNCFFTNSSYSQQTTPEGKALNYFVDSIWTKSYSKIKTIYFSGCSDSIMTYFYLNSCFTNDQAFSNKDSINLLAKKRDSMLQQNIMFPLKYSKSIYLYNNKLTIVKSGFVSKYNLKRKAVIQVYNHLNIGKMYYVTVVLSYLPQIFDVFHFELDNNLKIVHYCQDN